MPPAIAACPVHIAIKTAGWGVTQRERCLQVDGIFGRDSKKTPPKRGCQVGGTPSQRDHHSLDESSKCVQIDVAFIHLKHARSSP